MIAADVYMSLKAFWSGAFTIRQDKNAKISWKTVARLFLLIGSDRASRKQSMQMGGAESFEHVQKPATAIQDHVSSHNSIYNGPAWCIRPVYDQSRIFEIVKCIYKCIVCQT